MKITNFVAVAAACAATAISSPCASRPARQTHPLNLTKECLRLGTAEQCRCYTSTATGVPERYRAFLPLYMKDLADLSEASDKVFENAGHRPGMDASGMFIVALTEKFAENHASNELAARLAKRMGGMENYGVMVGYHNGIANSCKLGHVDTPQEVEASYIKAPPTKTFVVGSSARTIAPAPVRAGPSLDAKVTDAFQAGLHVVIKGQEGNWVHIFLPQGNGHSIDGWMAAQFLGPWP